MKTILNDSIKIVMYLIFGLLLIMSSYIIISNILHYQSLASEVIVSEVDNDYLEYKNNINLIEEIIQKDTSNSKIVSSLSMALDSMKRKGVFRLIPKSKLNSKDIYELNDYFMEELINDNWISHIKEFEISNKYQDMVMILVNNSKYLNKVLTKNSSSFHLGSSIEDDYHYLLNNYLVYSKVILNICNELGGKSG